MEQMEALSKTRGPLALRVFFHIFHPRVKWEQQRAAVGPVSTKERRTTTDRITIKQGLLSQAKAPSRAVTVPLARAEGRGHLDWKYLPVSFFFLLYLSDLCCQFATSEAFFTAF
jgi:hypothetical protein